MSAETAKLVHRTVKKVGEDIEGLRFNTAISAMMILANERSPANACESLGKIDALPVDLRAASGRGDLGATGPPADDSGRGLAHPRPGPVRGRPGRGRGAGHRKRGRERCWRRTPARTRPGLRPSRTRDVRGGDGAPGAGRRCSWGEAGWLRAWVHHAHQNLCLRQLTPSLVLRLLRDLNSGGPCVLGLAACWAPETVGSAGHAAAGPSRLSLVAARAWRRTPKRRGRRCRGPGGAGGGCWGHPPGTPGW